MGNFARPDTVTLTITGGDTLVVKRRLSALDSRRMRGMEKLPTLAEVGVVMAYLVDWSLVDDQGARVPIQGDAFNPAMANALDALDADRFDEIVAAVTAHVAAMTKEREAEKNNPGGANKSPVISPSPDIVTGPTSTSAT